MHKEFGGFLPIELFHGREYFSDYPVERYNCANAAISRILEINNFKKIYAPLYLCPNACAELEKHNVTVSYYHLNNDIIPCSGELCDEEGSLVYVVDYFGVMDNKTTSFVSGIKNATVIVDFCHSFFCEPILKENVFNIYSARKFFGVPDGAYLVCKDVEKYQAQKVFYSSDYASYILTSYEHGTNYCYSDKKYADTIIQQNHGEMSELSRGIMTGADYEFVKKRRLLNSKTFNEAFKDINKIFVEENSAPYAYPLNFGKNIKKELISEKIYVPTLWSQLLQDKYYGTYEFDLTENTLFLPVDQRYDNEDMEYMINVIKKYL